MTTRRNFFRVLGLAGGVAASGVAGAAAIVATSEKSETVKKIEAMGSTYNTLTLQSEYGELAPPEKPTGLSCYTINTRNHRFVPGTHKQVNVSMTVGPDGEMYLKTNGKWRKVVTE
jgi:hypothetical protein